MCRSSTITVGRDPVSAPGFHGRGSADAPPGSESDTDSAVWLWAAVWTAPLGSVTPVKPFGSPEEEETCQDHHYTPDDAQLPRVRIRVNALQMPVTAEQSVPDQGDVDVRRIG